MGNPKERRLPSRRLLVGGLETAAPWLRLFSFTENGGADSDKRRAFFHCNAVIVCHSHRKLRQLYLEFFFDRITQLAKFHEIPPRSLRLFSKGRNTHQTFDRQSREHQKRFQLGSH